MVGASKTEGSGEYFTSYENFEIHRLMLDDRPRTEAYKNAIFAQSSYFKDKVVMDVGAGTGILSVFCAQAGAKKVYAVEASNLAQIITKVAEENNFSNVIEVIHSRVEDVVLPGDEKVDAIVSEWMGFYLLHEAMFDSVIVARDKHLKSDGKMFPEKASLFASACSLPTFYDYWNDVYGVRMEVVGAEERRLKSDSPKVVAVKAEDLITKPELVCSLDLLTICSSDIDSITKRVVTPATRDGKYQGICLWFECAFPTSGESPEIVLSTSPEAPITHWKQTAIVLQHTLDVEEGQPIAWELNVNRNKEYQRQYDLQLEMLDPEKEKHPMPCHCQMTKCIVIRAFLETAEGEACRDDYIEDNFSDEEDELEDYSTET